jgi:FKBP-type peptidyl-prolyl cis-trans isomerase
MHIPISVISVFAGSLLVFAVGCGSDGDRPAPFADHADEFTVTESGLNYLITREGDGEKPKPTDAVVVHYRGKLADGSEFDSSYKRKEPAGFSLGGVIPGWTEGLQLVKVGGMIELIVPPDLGYGESGTRDGSIPPNATLYFTVELLEIQKVGE